MDVREVDAPGAWPVLGHLPRMRRRPLEFFSSLAAQGDLVRIRLGPTAATVVCDPALVRDVFSRPGTFDKGGALYDKARHVTPGGLLTCTWAEHQHQRALVQPAFARNRLESYVPVMWEEVSSMLAAWHPAVRDLISHYTAAFADRLYRAGTVVFDLFALQDLADRIRLGSSAKYQVMGMCVGHPHIPDHVSHEIERDIAESAHELADRMLEDLRALLTSTDPADSTAATDVTGPAGW
ncbi:cytochrome P450 [Kitasatospora sp. NPDC058397]|uniref:cytochrome P450 n=1 Tax=unclassified Kitasatospora TaxID=2633591 RepID=UPI0036593AA8